MSNSKKVLVSGATGYVGSRLIPKLLYGDYRVRAISRNLSKLEGRPWIDHNNVEPCEANALEEESLVKACEGCDVVYYLIHSMGSGNEDFEEADRKAARNMVGAAEKTDINQIIYLGGLGDSSKKLSPHLESRAEVAKILKSGEVPATVLRAAVIIGSGSASFEILRYLVERLPIMTTPKWVHTKNQPIAIRNVLNYLVGCLRNPDTKGETFDIGGPDVLTYGQLMREYAEAAGLMKRIIIPLPFLTPKLSAYWVHLVTPVPASIAYPLVEGMTSPVVCEDDRIKEYVDQDLLPIKKAIELALEKTENNSIESRWSDAGSIPPAEWSDEDDPDWAGGDLFEDRRTVEIDTKPETVWEVIIRIGGKNGWYFANWLWMLRGLLDRILGGVGLRRGRRNPSELQVGDALDFWRVLELDQNQRLKLVAEMKLPGEATLEFRINKTDEGTIRVDQIARFRPSGLLGLLYWYGVYPLHGYVFRGMLRNIASQTNETILENP